MTGLCLRISDQNPRHIPDSRRAGSPRALIWLLSLLVAAGCTDRGELEPHPVHGKVVVNGEPATGCTVVFVPLDPSLKGKVMPGGTTNDDGMFRVTTHETGDGAPLGEYGVTLRWEATKWEGMNKGPRVDPGRPEGPDRLQGRFSSPDKSGLTVVIEEGDNDLKPFKLDDVPLLPGSE